MAIRLEGPWKAGWALDWHTSSSTLRPDGTFDTLRPRIGEALYRLKYRGERQQVEPLATAAADYITELLARPYLSGLIPVPPSDTGRMVQPVIEVARSIASRTGLPLHEDYLLKVRQTAPLKSVEERDERHDQLAGAFRVADGRFAGKRLLIFDDLYRSGTTLAEITRTLMEQGRVERVYVLTLTRTRVRR